MVEWIPWLLILIGWHSDTPDDQRIIEIRVVFDKAECELHGNEYVATRKMYREELGPYEYRYLCSPMPDREAFKDAWESRMTQDKPAPEAQ